MSLTNQTVSKTSGRVKLIIAQFWTGRELSNFRQESRRRTVYASRSRRKKPANHLQGQSPHGIAPCRENGQELYRGKYRGPLAENGSNRQHLPVPTRGA